jgi:hypothetical protein
MIWPCSDGDVEKDYIVMMPVMCVKGSAHG